MGFSKDLLDSVKRVCNNDETCVLIVLVLVGFMLCFLFKDQISGYVDYAPFGSEINNDNVNNNGIVVSEKPNMVPDPGIGIQLKPRVPENIPQPMKGKFDTMKQKPSMPSMGKQMQKPGLMVQDSMIFKPFDEVWNPGFMPLDMVFKDVQKQPQVGPMGPMGPDRPMKPQGAPGMGAQAAMGGQPGMGAQAAMGGQPGMGAQAAMGGQPGMGDQGGGKGELKIILVYAPWCGHSKRMLGDYERVKSEFDGQVVNGNKVSIIMYNSDVDKDKVKEYGVKGFPTLFVEKNGNRQPFPHRTYDKISEYIKSA